MPEAAQELRRRRRRLAISTVCAYGVLIALAAVLLHFSSSREIVVVGELQVRQVMSPGPRVTATSLVPALDHPGWAGGTITVPAHNPGDGSVLERTTFLHVLASQTIAGKLRGLFAGSKPKAPGWEAVVRLEVEVHARVGSEVVSRKVVIHPTDARTYRLEVAAAGAGIDVQLTPVK